MSGFIATQNSDTVTEFFYFPVTTSADYRPLYERRSVEAFESMFKSRELNRTSGKTIYPNYLQKAGLDRD